MNTFFDVAVSGNAEMHNLELLCRLQELLQGEVKFDDPFSLETEYSSTDGTAANSRN